MSVVIIGNGIMGLTTAYRLTKKDPNLKIQIVGPSDHKGCASLAAAAMFNSFCEVDPSTLTNKFERIKFDFNRSANPLWPQLLEQLHSESGLELFHNFGTYLINNHATDDLEDKNFDAILAALKEFSEPHEVVKPSEIDFFKPSARTRASRAVLIPREGYVNPRHLFQCLFQILRSSSRVSFVDNSCVSLNFSSQKIVEAKLENNKLVSGDCFVLAPGAVFSKIVQDSHLPIMTPKIFYGIGVSVLLKTSENTIRSCIRTPNRGLACGIYSAPHDETHTLVGASNFIAPFPEDFGRLTSVYGLLGSAMEQINSDFYRSQLEKVNVGWRPTSEDTLPLIGRSETFQNLLIATGTKRDGLHCSPVISDVISDLVLGRTPKFDISHFNPERKPIRVYSRSDAIETSVKHTVNAAYQHGFVPSKNRIVEDLESHYRREFEELHDKVGALDWGIPPEMINMYKYGHVR